MSDEIRKTEQQIFELTDKLLRLRRNEAPTPIKNYKLLDSIGEVSLLDLFGDKQTLFAIHNMGQGCRYCTLWADGLNGFLPHLEDRFAVVLMSKDSPQIQRQFANSRNWRFRMVSHGGGEYSREQCIRPGENNAPGLVCYARNGSQIFRKSATGFGPGDLFCSLWHILSLAGIGSEDWTPQYNYWKRPTQLDDGGQNLL